MIALLQAKRFIRKETDRVKMKFNCNEKSYDSYQRIMFLKAVKKIEKLVTDPNLERPAYNVLLKMSAVGNNF